MARSEEHVLGGAGDAGVGLVGDRDGVRARCVRAVQGQGAGCVSPSCETARHTPSVGSIAALSAGRACTSARPLGVDGDGDQLGDARARRARRFRTRQTITGRLCSSASAISGRLRSCRAVGVEQRFGQRWLCGDHLLHHPRRPGRSSGKASVCQSWLLMIPRLGRWRRRSEACPCSAGRHGILRGERARAGRRAGSGAAGVRTARSAAGRSAQARRSGSAVRPGR